MVTQIFALVILELCDIFYYILKVLYCYELFEILTANV